MPIRTRIDTTLGPVSYNNDTGISIERGTANRGFSPFPVDGVPTIGSSTLTAGDGGVNIISGSGVQTVVLPRATDCNGAEFIFRVGSASAHIVTSSQETAGVTTFVSGATLGAKLTFAAVVGSAVVLKSDGIHFHVLGGFGANGIT